MMLMMFKISEMSKLRYTGNTDKNIIVNIKQFSDLPACTNYDCLNLFTWVASCYYKTCLNQLKYEAEILD